MSDLFAVLFVPLAGALLGAASARVVPIRIRPAVATRVTTALVVVSATAVLWSLFLVTFSTIIEVHGVAERIPWCRAFAPVHTDRPNPLGAVAFVLLVASVFGGARAARRHRRLRASDSNGGLAVVPSTKPAAYALPGRPGQLGQIVVSRGMLQLLDGDERRALFAHERAHLELRHHRYLRAAEISAALVLPLWPLVARVRLSTERWADEEAANAVGDRRLVARALARAALAQPASTRFGVLGMGDSAVVQRVEALLSPPPKRQRMLEIAFCALALTSAISLLASAEQVHHLLTYALGLCWL